MTPLFCFLGFLVLTALAWLFVRFWVIVSAPISSRSPKVTRALNPIKNFLSEALWKFGVAKFMALVFVLLVGALVELCGGWDKDFVLKLADLGVHVIVEFMRQLRLLVEAVRAS